MNWCDARRAGSVLSFAQQTINYYVDQAGNLLVPFLMELMKMNISDRRAKIMISLSGLQLIKIDYRHIWHFYFIKCHNGSESDGKRSKYIKFILPPSERSNIKCMNFALLFIWCEFPVRAHTSRSCYLHTVTHFTVILQMQTKYENLICFCYREQTVVVNTKICVLIVITMENHHHSRIITSVAVPIPEYGSSS